MRNFLKKLNKKNKLDIVDSNKKVCESYLEKSESNMISAKILLDANRLEEATSLIYYSSYHLLLALLFRAGIKSENHSASIYLLTEIFDIDNDFLLFAKKERVDKQYYVSFDLVEKDVKNLIEKAEKFNSYIFDFISKLNNAKIKIYRNKFIELIKQ